MSDVTNIFHKDLVKLSPKTFLVVSNVEQTKNGKPYIKLKSGENKYIYFPPNRKVAKEVDGLSGQTVTLIATGDEQNPTILVAKTAGKAVDAPKPESPVKTFTDKENAIAGHTAALRDVRVKASQLANVARLAMAHTLSLTSDENEVNIIFNFLANQLAGDYKSMPINAFKPEEIQVQEPKEE
jgi:hypothetical protein